MFDVHLVQINKSPPSYPVPIDLPKETISEGNQSCQNPIKIGDLVEITFIGSLPDGKVFDNGTMTPLKFILAPRSFVWEGSRAMVQSSSTQGQGIPPCAIVASTHGQG